MAGKQGRGESAHSPRRLTARQRQAEALRLKATGLTYEEIARWTVDGGERLYANASGAWKAVDRALSEQVAHGVERLRELECQRLDSLTSALWPKRASWQTAETLRRIIETRCKLLGLNAPTVITTDSLLDQARMLAQALGVDEEWALAKADEIIRATQRVKLTT